MNHSSQRRATTGTFVLALFLGTFFTLPASCQQTEETSKSQPNDNSQRQEIELESGLAHWTETIPADDKAACEAAGGYWYKGKCWKNFEDEGISNEDIDRVVAKEMAALEEAVVKLGDESYPVEFFFPESTDEDGNSFELIIAFNNLADNIFIECRRDQLESGDEFKAQGVHVKGNVFEGEDGNEAGECSVTIKGNEDFDISIDGTLKSNESGKEQTLVIRLNQAAGGRGASKLEIKDGEAFLSGTLGTVTYPQIKDLIENHPKIKTVTMTQVDGSINDAVNMHTGRILREAGLNTKVLADSVIASGGVDLFCAGVERIVVKGARLGVHSWAAMDFTADDLPKDHPAHQYQVAYFSQMLDQVGEEFYFYTLSAAPARDIHFMSKDELEKWKVVTKFVSPEREAGNGDGGSSRAIDDK